MFLSLGLYENENYFCENESGFKNVSQKLDKNEPAIELVESNPDNSIKKIVALKSKSKTFSQSNNVLEDESKNVFNKLDSEDNRVTFGENVKKLKNRSNASHGRGQRDIKPAAEDPNFAAGIAKRTCVKKGVGVGHLPGGAIEANASPRGVGREDCSLPES